MEDAKEINRQIEYQKSMIHDDSYEAFKIIFYFNSKEALYGFTASGETGFSQYGFDIIAAAVSTLVINTINSLRLLTNEVIDYEIKRNFAKCILSNAKRNKGSKEGLVLLESLRMGITSIQDSYGDKFVEIIESREEKKHGIFNILGKQ
jgi:uncharacterized protein YsxB (DUF464 family)